MERGNHKSEVDRGQYVIRLANPDKCFRVTDRILTSSISDDEFNLSSADKSSDPPPLSVWHWGITCPLQAHKFLGEDSPKRLAIYLDTSEICDIQVMLAENTYSNHLKVIWFHIEITDVPEEKHDLPGAKGHAGIVGLSEDCCPLSLNKKQRKEFRKYLRVKLADLASKDYTLIDNQYDPNRVCYYS